MIFLHFFHFFIHFLFFIYLTLETIVLRTWKEITHVAPAQKSTNKSWKRRRRRKNLCKHNFLICEYVCNKWKCHNNFMALKRKKRFLYKKIFFHDDNVCVGKRTTWSILFKKLSFFFELGAKRIVSVLKGFTKHSSTIRVLNK